MNEPPFDQAPRDRFRLEWDKNFAVLANAGSGKTTAISERLAAMALSPAMAGELKRTAVVTFARKAAAEIEQRSRAVLVRRLQEGGSQDLRALDRLEAAFFGTIHSFCLLLGRNHGHSLGLHLNADVIDDDDEAPWSEFIEQDPMTFSCMGEGSMRSFLRHTPIERIFDLARTLDTAGARRLLERPLSEVPPEPSGSLFSEIMALPRAGRSEAAVRRNQELASEWLDQFRTQRGFLPLPKAQGTAKGIDKLFSLWIKPLKTWLASAAGALAGELALRYKEWRMLRGIQTHADQVDSALEILADRPMLEQIRQEGWRIILDEAQDTDPKQFTVLVEIARPPGSEPGTWPGPGSGPRPGHFCMVGDGQQGIYSTRADIRHFQRHMKAFSAEGADGESLAFQVTFRSPARVVSLVNRALGPAFGPGRPFNLGLPSTEGAPPPLLQVPFVPLIPRPGGPSGYVGIIDVSPSAEGGVEERLASEARQVAQFLLAQGPAGVGASAWGEVCVLAPRNAWLATIREAFEAAGLPTALQIRGGRSGDNAAYAWMAGLLSILCDPENTFEWVGVLREVFAVSDAAIAALLRSTKTIEWEEPEVGPASIQPALKALRPFFGRVDGDGESLGGFVRELAQACGLEGKAMTADPSGAVSAELRRLESLAADLGLEGGGPRSLLRRLLSDIDRDRPSGRAGVNAINLLTSHSAKGLEWPVVLAMGLWRPLIGAPAKGLKLIRADSDDLQVIFDSEGLDPETKESLERAQDREKVRLLYVTLTRAQRVLLLAWGQRPSNDRQTSLERVFGVSRPVLADFLGGDKHPPFGPAAELPEPVGFVPQPKQGGLTAPALPKRVLPHELAGGGDRPLAARHESALDGLPAGDGTDPLDYGLWWHGVMEFFPWQAGELEVGTYGARALERASALGFFERGSSEWAAFISGSFCRTLREPRWNRQAEIGIFAPHGEGGWIDGVVDLVLHDGASEVWIVDWKTNRKRIAETDEQFLGRLCLEYEPQLRAYAAGSSLIFQGCVVRSFIYSTASAAFREITP